MTNDSDPSLDYLNHSMDSLIQRLVPTDTYIPKVFISSIYFSFSILFFFSKHLFIRCFYVQESIFDQVYYLIN